MNRLSHNRRFLARLFPAGLPAPSPIRVVAMRNFPVMGFIEGHILEKYLPFCRQLLGRRLQWRRFPGMAFEHRRPYQWIYQHASIVQGNRVFPASTVIQQRIYPAQYRIDLRLSPGMLSRKAMKRQPVMEKNLLVGITPTSSISSGGIRPDESRLTDFFPLPQQWLRYQPARYIIRQISAGSQAGTRQGNRSLSEKLLQPRASFRSRPQDRDLSERLLTVRSFNASRINPSPPSENAGLTRKTGALSGATAERLTAIRNIRIPGSAFEARQFASNRSITPATRNLITLWNRLSVASEMGARRLNNLLPQASSLADIKAQERYSLDSDSSLTHRVSPGAADKTSPSTGAGMHPSGRTSPAAQDGSRENDPPQRRQRPEGIANADSLEERLGQPEIDRVAEAVYHLIEQKLRIENESKGIFL